MPNKTKQEPVNTGSPTPKPKKRGRKPSKKQYFTSDVDAAIKNTYQHLTKKKGTQYILIEFIMLFIN